MQVDIIAEAEELDNSGKRFFIDRWERDVSNLNSGYGITAVLEGGGLLEKAAVSISVVSGTLTPARARAMCERGRPGVDIQGGQPYAATALSLVFHPAHPKVPTLRADVRRFEVGGSAWFGGGCDLTPAYLNEADARAFHAFWRRLCDRHRPAPSLYEECKAACDAYFYLPARREHRGIGGVFFDDMAAGAPGGGGAVVAEAFACDVAAGVLPSWRGIAAARRQDAFGPAEREWQLLRRGRYVEFNLLIDRGVRFGLDGGRVESIMVSAPPLVAWRYMAEPKIGSAEAALLAVLREPRTWA
ncbi:hypothetical protein WJX81_002110 [Elliptochloris bilobata]|uniref:Coproporphyrinogen oxidase n=1 Tax=Elliptochloris bilobata TaxID=381761 RepID=A0AAW1RCU3_9CHLO